MPEIGLVAGAMNPAVDLRVTAGIGLKKWDFGAGIGFDEYKQPSYPLFIQARRNLEWGKWHPFVLTSIGYNYKSGSDSLFTWFGNKVQDYRGGLYAEAGLGLVFKIRKKERFHIGLYQSYKQSSTTTQEWVWAGPGSNITVPSTVLHKMYRVSCRIGWKFGR